MEIAFKRFVSGVKEPRAPVPPSKEQPMPPMPLLTADTEESPAPWKAATHPAAPNAGTTRPKAPGGIPSWLDALRISTPAGNAGPGAPPIEENATEEMAAAAPERKGHSRRATSIRAIFIIAVLWILVLAGGALYFGTANPSRETLGRLLQGLGGSAAENPVYDIRDVRDHIEKGISGESLYVIRGTVANVGKASSKGIRIQATLLGKDNAALLDKAAFAGNLLDDTALRNMNQSGIEGFLGKRDGEGRLNRNIPAGKSLPFMVVFFDPPKQVESFLVKAMDVDNPGRIHSSKGK